MTEWISASGNPEASATNLSPSSTSGARYEVGRGSIEITAGYGMTRSEGAEYTNAPTPDIETGLTFKTQSGAPVPNGQPRMDDLVMIGGMPVRYGQAIRDGLVPNPAALSAGEARSGPVSAPQSHPHGNPQPSEDASPEAAQSLADNFSSEVLPRVSSATVASLEADLKEGHFSEKTLDYLQLEGGQNLASLSAVRDAYADKVTAATGLDEGELQELWQSDRAAFNAAASEMLKTGSTAAFEQLATQSDAGQWSAISDDAAAEAWRSPEFPQALIDAGLEPVFEGGVVSIKIPGMGIVPWSEAVERGLVKVSRYG